MRCDEVSLRIGVKWFATIAPIVPRPVSGRCRSRPQEEAEGTVEGGDTLTVDTTAGDTTEVQEPTTEDGTVETVKTEKPKLNEKKSNPLADVKDNGKATSPRTIADDSEATPGGPDH